MGSGESAKFLPAVWGTENETTAIQPAIDDACDRPVCGSSRMVAF